MPTLSPFGLLVIFLALSVAPPSATHVTPPSVAFKREGTGLVLGSLPDQAETRTDLAAQFELTGREDLGAGR